MPRRKKQKRDTPAHVNFVMMDVDNPSYSHDHKESQTNPRKVPAAFNLNDTYAGFLFARKAIDEADWRAVLHITRAYEAMGGAGAGAIDYSAEKVDGGQIAKTITEGHLNGSYVLREAQQALGPQGYDITLKFTVQGMRPKDIATSEKRRKYYTERYKECLDTLATLWGWKKRPIRSYVA